MRWHIVTHEESGYPLVVYPEKSRADHLVQKNGGNVVSVDIPSNIHIYDDNIPPRIIDHLYE